MGDLGLANSVWQRFQGVSKMKLEIARGLFLVGALGVAALALAAWIVGLSYIARRESRRGPMAYWPLVFLAIRANTVIIYIMLAHQVSH